VQLALDLDHPVLWHFDFPALYRAVCLLVRDGEVQTRREVEFGIRKVEVKNGFYYLNGEPMRLMGVEWMPGSDPRYGMAEPREVTRTILRDMKSLNVILTRFHWQQDDFVFQFGDNEGLLIQEEIPAWGSRTMEGRLDEVQAMQMKEMISAHYNHPSIYAWGLCNEIGGQSEKAHQFVRRGMELGRRLDPTRLLTWASNSLQSTPEKDASGLVDFIEWNDYWESWYRGDLSDLEQNLARIREAFPDKALVISEYGLCECDPRNPSGDERRIEILRTHTDRYRKASNVAGAIFFDYNDYRTHIGDKGKGAFQQRVHGVVDLLGRRKPSYEALKRECSPVKQIRIEPPVETDGRARATVEISSRDLKTDLPAYTLRGYTLIWEAYNGFHQPIAAGKLALPDLAPGAVHQEDLTWESFDDLREIHVEIFRPTGYSVLEGFWRVEE
jgi:beta-glucuronidase